MTNISDSQPTVMRRALMAIDQLQNELQTLRQAEREPIAIIGMACRFPGKANNLDAYWSLLRDGVDAITEVPRDRWDVNMFYDPNPETPGKMYCRWGGFLDKIDEFDPAFFGIAPREACRMDPQQRMLLEITWRALEHAGIVPSTLAGTAAGVFIGCSAPDYWVLQATDPYAIDMYSATGSGLFVTSNRISYFLDVRGPSMTIDTACSSSLVAVHEACQHLRSRQCSLAIAGGVNAVLGPGGTLGMSKLNALSPDGRCKPFDASANGFVRGEGCGVVVLKRLSDAVAAGDAIAAVIRGSAVQSEGRSNGLTAPSAPAQEALLRQALASAGVDPSHVSYIETHGTGTALGDPIEVEALVPVYGAARQDGLPCLLGSVKSNFGHLESAAGIAGLIKAVLCLQHRAVVPTVHFQSLNPHISFDGTRLGVATSYEPWPPSDTPLFSAVSSFGISGTIAHVILEEYRRDTVGEISTDQALQNQAFLLPLSARDPAALRALATTFRDDLVHGSLAAERLSDVCRSAAVHRTHYDHRLAVVGDTHRAVTEGLSAFLRGESRSSVIHGRCQTDDPKRLVFVFNGHGSQWVGMARSLMETDPAFREAIERCDEAIHRETGWRLCAELQSDEPDSRLEDVDVVQRVIFAMHIALAAQWRAFGVQPAAVIGHSLGEIAAAHVAGILSLDDAVRVVCARSRLVRERAGSSGGLLAVEMTPADAKALVAPYGRQLVVGVINGPSAVALSGQEESLREVQEQLHHRGVFCRRVRIRFASHSPLMRSAADGLRQELRDIQPREAHVPFFSTVTGRIEQGTTLDADYWARNLMDQVQFASSVQSMGRAGYECFLEIGGHPVLLQPISDNLAHVGIEGIAIASLIRGHGDRSRLLAGLGEIYCAGCPVEFRHLYPDSLHQFIPVPPYPFQRKRYWLPRKTSVTLRPAVDRDQSSHPVFRLGVRVPSALNDRGYLWHFKLGTELLPYLADHTVKQMVVMPGAMHLELALSAAREILDGDVLQIYDVTFIEALVLPEKAMHPMQVTLSGDPSVGAEFRISTCDIAAQKWTVHSRGWVRVDCNPREAPALAEPVSVIRERCRRKITKEEHYRQAGAQGMHYGSTFRGLEAAWVGDGEMLAQIQWPEDLQMDAGGYTFHPAILDACFQALLGMTDSDGYSATGAVWMPVSVRSAQAWAPIRPRQKVWSYARRVDALKPVPDMAISDTIVFDDDGKLLLEVRGIGLRRAGPPAKEQPNDWLYALSWKAQTVTSGEQRLTGTWLILADDGGMGQAVANTLAQEGVQCILAFCGSEFHRVQQSSFTLNPVCPEHFHLLLDTVQALGPLQGMIHLWALNAAPSPDIPHDALGQAADASCAAVSGLVDAIAARMGKSPPQLWLVTREAQYVSEGDRVPAVAHAALWGLGRANSSLHPELQCRRIDLGAGHGCEGVELLCRSLGVEPGEDEFALRGDQRLVSRLVRHPALLERDGAPAIPLTPGRDAFRLILPRAGDLDDLTLVHCRRREPGHGEMQIAVRAASLNFRDVLKALGEYPDQATGEISLGDECAGVVTALGEGVTEFTVGDEVIAVLGGHAFASFVTVKAERVILKPPHLGFEEAATIPVAFVTSWYALRDQARVRTGERVLIHAAAGGVGLAAVQIARHLGAEIYATAGTPEKRAFLESLGVTHTFDSRSLAFVDEIREATEGQGVDVVLNSLAAEFTQASLSILRPFGRFVEIGKKSIHGDFPLRLAPFQHSLSFISVDLELLASKRPLSLNGMLRDVMNGFLDGWLTPICRQVFPISQATDAFHCMAQGKHIGKIALSFEQAQVHVRAAAADGVVFSPDATYLITEGPGAWSLALARWMVERGARHLMLMDRNDPTENAQGVIGELNGANVDIRVERADVSVQEDLRRALHRIDASMPSLRGIMHAAAADGDGLPALARQLTGAWNLHLETRDRLLDHFVLFSFATGLFDAPAEASASSLFDALAWHRHALGLPGLSIDWGHWSDSPATAAQAKRTDRLAGMGLSALPSAATLDAVGLVLGQGHPAVRVMRLHPRGQSDAARQSSLLLDLEGDELSHDVASAGTGNVRAQLLDAEPPARASLLTAHVAAQLAKVLQLSPEQIRENTPFRNMGMDSLTSLQFKNRLEASLDLRLSAAAIWNYPTVSKLVVDLARMLEVSLAEVRNSMFASVRASVRPSIRPRDDDLEGTLGDLSDEELAALVGEDMDDLD